MALAPPEVLQDRPVSDEAARLYRLIADSIPHMVWVTRADGGADFFNQRWYDYTGLRHGEPLGWGWRAVLHPDDLERCLAIWSEALQSGERYEIEYRLRRIDGTYRWHHGTAVPMRDPDGHVLRWFGTCTDIEDQIRSAQILETTVAERTRELRETQGRLREIIDNQPECVKLLDPQGRLLEMNAAGLRMVEAEDAGLVLGQCVYGLVATEHRDAFRDLTERVCRGERGHLEFEMVGLKGTRRWLETHAVPFREEATGELRLLGITRDVTDRRRTERALRESTADVRRLMDRLVAAQESERRRLADDLHDLIGQNLTALGIDLTTLKQHLPAGTDAACGQRVDTMRSLVEKTIDAIRGVMTDLRPPALEEFGLAPALRWYVAEFSERTGMKASLSMPGVDHRLPRDAELALFRIAQEALTNAAKHSAGSSVHVGLTENAGRLRLSVEDDGRGFADPVGARRARRGGWGLPAMRERAEAHGGMLTIEFPGRGTRLIVEIPGPAG
jgi:PAS domain S-box-containing protein